MLFCHSSLLAERVQHAGHWSDLDREAAASAQIGQYGRAQIARRRTGQRIGPSNVLNCRGSAWPHSIQPIQEALS
jgi:hypothetical protein